MDAAYKFETCTADIRQAYLQSVEPTSRPVFIKNAVLEFVLFSDESLQSFKPLCGLSESGDHWFETLDNHHEQELGMDILCSGPALYVSRESKEMNGLSGTNVDDMLRVGTKISVGSLKEHMNDLRNPAMKNDLVLPLNLNSTEETTGHFSASKQLPTKLDVDTGRCNLRRHCLHKNETSLAHTQSHKLPFSNSQLTQLTRKSFEEDRRKIERRINKLVVYSKEYQTALRFVKLDLSSLKLIGFSDTAFAGNWDFTSQLGHIILVSDKSGAVVPMLYEAFKALCVTRSEMIAELIAFSNMFDAGFTLRIELGHLHPGLQVYLCSF